MLLAGTRLPEGKPARRGGRRRIGGLGNFYQKQQRVWMGLEQTSGGEPAPLSPTPEPRRQQLVEVLIAARTKWGQ